MIQEEKKEYLLGETLRALVHRRDDILFIRLSGDIVHDNTGIARQFFGDMIKDQKVKMAIDMGGVCYIHSHGFGLLCLVHRMIVTKNGGALVFHSLGKHIKHLFGVLSLDTVFIICDSQKEAVALLNKA